MDFVRSGAFIAHRPLDCVGDLGRTPPARRNVQDTEPCRAAFLLKGGESSGYPFSNRWCYQSNPISEILPLRV